MTFDPTRVLAIFFDVDGTLRDTDDEYAARFARWLRPIQKFVPGLDPVRWGRWLVMRIETPANFLYGLPDRLHIDAPLATIGDWIAAQLRHAPGHKTRLIPGVGETLTRLASEYPLSVISARGERPTMAFLNEHQLESYFKVVATAQTVQRTKPHPAPLAWCAAQLSLPISNCLMVGDTTVDIQAGKRAGAQTVGVLCGFGEEGELRQAGADAILIDIQQLPILLRGALRK
jgi:phosphoglycolate phosphatase